MVTMPRLRCAAALVVLLGTESALHAQRTAENAVTMADDAFGTSIGLESTGSVTQTQAQAARLELIQVDRLAGDVGSHECTPRSECIATADRQGGGD